MLEEEEKKRMRLKVREIILVWAGKAEGGKEQLPARQPVPIRDQRIRKPRFMMTVR